MVLCLKFRGSRESARILVNEIKQKLFLFAHRKHAYCTYVPIRTIIRAERSEFCDSVNFRETKKSSMKRELFNRRT